MGRRVCIRDRSKIRDKPSQWSLTTLQLLYFDRPQTK